MEAKVNAGQEVDGGIAGNRMRDGDGQQADYGRQPNFEKLRKKKLIDSGRKTCRNYNRTRAKGEQKDNGKRDCKGQ